MMRIRKIYAKSKFALTLAIVALLFATPLASAKAAIEIDITRGNVEALLIAIPNIIGSEDIETPIGNLEEMGTLISSVVQKDLESSGLFDAIDHEAFIAEPIAAEVRPRFGNWRAIGALALVTGKVEREADGRLAIEFRLWDVFSESQMAGLRYVAPPQNWRRVAHLISDSIYQRLTGEKGYFDTRVVYIDEVGPKTNRIKRLSIMDQDGANQKFLTSGDDLVLTPRFSPTRQEITYLAYYNEQPRVYLYNIDTGKHEVLGDFPTMTFAPRFSPDGNKVVMSLAENGNSDVYIMDLRTREVKRLTTHPGIDTSPSFSPDGRNLTFNSDRGGSQQIYIMSVNGENIRRISFGAGRYATPVWSPRGDLIAFTKIADRKFRIGVMQIDGSGERVLTDSYQDEGPTWSPNGRVLMFFRQEPYEDDGSGGQTSLWSVDLTGYNERKIETVNDASDPAWSPLLNSN